MLFPWFKNQTKKKNFIKQNVVSLLEELKIYGIKDNNILYAIKKIPRELFVKEYFIREVYKNIPLPIDCSQTISQPYVVAYMILCLSLKNTDKVSHAEIIPDNTDYIYIISDKNHIELFVVLKIITIVVFYYILLK